MGGRRQRTGVSDRFSSKSWLGGLTLQCLLWYFPVQSKRPFDFPIPIPFSGCWGLRIKRAPTAAFSHSSWKDVFWFLMVDYSKSSNVFPWPDSLSRKWIDPLPIFFHVLNGPSSMLTLIQRFAQTSDVRVTIIWPFPISTRPFFPLAMSDLLSFSRTALKGGTSRALHTSLIIVYQKNKKIPFSWLWIFFQGFDG